MKANDVNKFIDDEMEAMNKRRKTEVYEIFNFDSISKVYNLNANNIAAVINACNLSTLTGVVSASTLVLYAAVCDKHYLTKEINYLNKLKYALEIYSDVFDNEDDLSYYLSDVENKFEEKLLKKINEKRK